jgi:hypothetical protein
MPMGFFSSAFWAIAIVTSLVTKNPWKNMYYDGNVEGVI